MWERCIRCGGNRVVKKPRPKVGGFFIIIGIFILGLFPGNESNQLFAIIFTLIGLLLIFKGHLYCKDCEYKWGLPKKKQTL